MCDCWDCSWCNCCCRWCCPLLLLVLLPLVFWATLSQSASFKVVVVVIVVVVFKAAACCCLFVSVTTSRSRSNQNCIFLINQYVFSTRRVRFRSWKTWKFKFSNGTKTNCNQRVNHQRISKNTTTSKLPLKEIKKTYVL